MPEPDLADAIRLASRALVLVSKGVGERTAVRRAAASEMPLLRVRSRALDLVIRTVREKDLLDKVIQSVIRDEKVPSGIFQIFRLAVHLARTLGENSSSLRARRAFRAITPVLYLRSLDLLFGSLPAIDSDRFFKDQSDTARVSLKTHHSAWWVDYCFNLFGRSEAIEFLGASSRPRYVRINPLKNSGRVSLPTRAKHLSEHLVPVPFQKGAYTVPGSLSRFSQFFKEGLFQIQDLASFLAVRAAIPIPGEQVLDLCAAPGAKTATLAQSMKNRGRIVSVDYSRGRMENWKREIARLGVKIAEPVICEGSGLSVHGAFDLTLIDPPCSGTGVFDRNPSMKWHILPESLNIYANLQRRFLDAACAQLQQNGRILYCTCSITVEENEQVVSSFLKMHPEFETRPVLREYGSPGLRGMTDCRRFYPHIDRTAGYFVALIQRST